MTMGFPCGSVAKNLPANAGNVGLIPGLGSPPGEGNGSTLQYSCQGNPIDRGVWWPTVHRVAKSRTRLRDWTHTHAYHYEVRLDTSPSQESWIQSIREWTMMLVTAFENLALFLGWEFPWGSGNWNFSDPREFLLWPQRPKTASPLGLKVKQMKGGLAEQADTWCFPVHPVLEVPEEDAN